MTDFAYEPSHSVPFRDKKVIERVREIKSEEIENHPNPDYKIRIVPDADLSIITLFDAFHRIKKAADNDEPMVMIMPNPWPQFRMLAHMLNKFRVDCRGLYTFMVLGMPSRNIFIIISIKILDRLKSIFIHSPMKISMTTEK